MRPREEVELVAQLIAAGWNDCQIARTTGVPRRTVLDWRHTRRRIDSPFEHEPIASQLPGSAYAYLLGIYLGDGCISAGRRNVWRLRIALDAAYPHIIEECRRALELVGPPNRIDVRQRHDSRCIDVSMYWKGWPWLFPQHGPGPKHLRAIRLAPWQDALVAANHQSFLRGLVHSDGCRYIAHECQAGRHRYSVRYAFANRSEDIKDLFCRSCDALGIRWTRTPKQVSVYRKDSVAQLDEFIGPKT
jgi:hypothetical protein